MLTAVPTALITGHTYAIAGRQLTGLTQATGYGDDRQNATNYPLVRLTNGAGDVRYLRTTDFSTLGIATGNATVTAALQVPPGIPPGRGTSPSWPTASPRPRRPFRSGPATAS